MNAAHILIVEDDANILRGLNDSLARQGYTTATANDGEAGLASIQGHPWDLIILDIMMPKRNGYDLCREIRKLDSNTPVLFLSAKSEEIDKVLGLELGGDDYLTKPFGNRELHARVAALLRRSHLPKEILAEREDLPDQFAFGQGTVDRKCLHFTSPHGHCIDLTARELKLLEFFHRHAEEALSRDQLLNAAWGVHYQGTTRTLDQHIAQLRKKVETDTARPRHILTVHGWGYKYTV